MDENLNKQTPETKAEEASADISFEEPQMQPGDEAANPAESTSDGVSPDIVEPDGLPGAQYEPVSSNRPAGLLRSAITAVIVLAVFAAVYFIVTAVYDKRGADDNGEQQKPMTEMSISTAPGDDAPSGETESAPETESVPDTETSPGTFESENTSSDSGTQVEVITSTMEETTSAEYVSATDGLSADAKAKYGDNIMVFPEYDGKIKTVSVGGSEKKCYMAAVVKITDGNGNTQIIHAAIDSETGTIWYDDKDKWEVID